MFNTTEYFEIKSHVNSIEPGLGRTGSQQAGYQIVALLVSLALALVGGLITGKLHSGNKCLTLNFNDWTLQVWFCACRCSDACHVITCLTTNFPGRSRNRRTHPAIPALRNPCSIAATRVQLMIPRFKVKSLDKYFNDIRRHASVCLQLFRYLLISSVVL